MRPSRCAFRTAASCSQAGGCAKWRRPTRSCACPTSTAFISAMLQTAFNGVITGVIMTLPALSVTLLFGVLKFPNFAIGSMMTVAAYMTFALNAQLGWPLALSTVVVAIVFGGLLIVIDYLTFKPLRGRGGITLMVASLGLGFILENVARFAYGNTARSFAIKLARPFRFLDIRMNREQMI